MTVSQDVVPAFNPRFECSYGMGMYYQDDRVEGAVDIYERDGKKVLCISEWSSSFTGQGHTKDALQWLRSQGFTTIVANGVGVIEEDQGVWAGDIATAYWDHMLRAGLVDVLVDDNGQTLTRDLLDRMGQPITEADVGH